jgi:hypothetical protein
MRLRNTALVSAMIMLLKVTMTIFHPTVTSTVQQWVRINIENCPLKNCWLNNYRVEHHVAELFEHISLNCFSIRNVFDVAPAPGRQNDAAPAPTSFPWFTVFGAKFCIHTF